MRRADNKAPRPFDLHGLNGFSDHTIDTHMNLYHRSEKEKELNYLYFS